MIRLDAVAVALVFGISPAAAEHWRPKVGTSFAIDAGARFAVTEDCFKQGWCAVSKNFIDAGKPVFAIEYTDNHIAFARFCAQAKQVGLSPLLKRRNLDEWERRCP